MKNILSVTRDRWHGEGGYRDILIVAVPLILSTGAWAVQHFLDRMFLTWYSSDALAASMPAGILNFSITSLFLGTASYTGTFVAQYFGAGKDRRIGPVLWQGVYIGLIAGLLHLMLIPPAGSFFHFIGHGPEIERLEAVYFKILCLAEFPVVAGAALSGFYAGRGETWPVMWVNFAATAMNVILNYILIFGHLGLPSLGIAGAGIATTASAFFSFFLYLALICRAFHRNRFNTLAGWRFNPALFARLIRFGLPNGVQFSLENIGFTVFILFVGRLGSFELAASNIAFNINMLAFMPMIGFGIAVSVMVGQNLGMDRPELAKRSTYSGFHLTFLYMSLVAAAYIFTPDLFLWPFASQADPASFGQIRETTVILLRFVAFYSIFDTMNIIFAAGIKGAGDTRFAMLLGIGLSMFGLALPIYIAIGLLGQGLYTAWTIATFYVCLLGLAFFLRFLGGKWKAMRVIEPEL